MVMRSHDRRLHNRCRNGVASVLLTFAVAAALTLHNAAAAAAAAATATAATPSSSSASTAAASSAGVHCPAGTHDPTRTARSSAGCVSCPAGSYCRDGGLRVPCPIGSFCPDGSSQPTACPPGTTRASTGATDVTQCLSCPAGYYCHAHTTHSVPYPCTQGSYCPAGSGEPTTCPGGYFCAPASIAPTTCDAGYFCPPGSPTPYPCPRGAYCGERSAQAVLCPAGTHGVVSVHDGGNGLRTNVQSACTACPAGTHGTDPTRTSCLPCSAGHICLGGTTTPTPKHQVVDAGYACPVGHYCESGVLKPSPCPAGTYQPSLGATNSSWCEPCPTNAYQPRAAASSCDTCGGSATSVPGSVTCKCHGAGRVYQPSDGSCPCRPMFVVYHPSNGTRGYDGDGTKDCVPRVYGLDGSASCLKRDSHTGECIDERDEASYCASMCHSTVYDHPSNSGAGRFDVNLGVCVCHGAASAATLCNATCQAGLPSATYQRSTISVMDPLTRSLYSVPPSEINGFVGASSMTCTRVGGCALVTIVCDGTGQRAVFGVSSGISTHTGLTKAAATSGRFTTTAAAGADSQAATVVSGIHVPTICLVAGESIVWELVDASHYPVYVRTSAMNTNPTFDYGAFRQLSALVASNATVTYFGFTFQVPGTYIFADASNLAAYTTVAVLPGNQHCPIALAQSKVVTTTTPTLVSLAVSPSTTVQETPSTTTVMALILLMAGLGLLVAVYTRFKDYRAKRSTEDDPKRKREEKATKLEFIKLIQQLQHDQKASEAGVFKEQKDFFENERNRIIAETEQVKALLAVKLTDGFGFVVAAKKLLTIETTQRNSHDDKQKKRETDVDNNTKALLKALGVLRRENGAVIPPGGGAPGAPAITGGLQVPGAGGATAGTSRRTSRAGDASNDMAARMATALAAGSRRPSNAGMIGLPGDGGAGDVKGGELVTKTMDEFLTDMLGTGGSGKADDGKATDGASSSDSAGVVGEIQKILATIGDVKETSTEERKRRHAFKENRAIIDAQFMNMLDKPEPACTSDEDWYLGKEYIGTWEQKLQIFQKELEDAKNEHTRKVKYVNDKYADKLSREQAIIAAQKRRDQSVLLSCSNLITQHATIASRLPDILARLNKSRDACRDARKAVLKALERRVDELSAKKDSVLFDGLDPDTSMAIKFFLRQHYKLLMPGDAAAMAAMQAAGGMGGMPGAGGFAPNQAGGMRQIVDPATGQMMWVPMSTAPGGGGMPPGMPFFSSPGAGGQPGMMNGAGGLMPPGSVTPQSGQMMYPTTPAFPPTMPNPNMPGQAGVMGMPGGPTQFGGNAQQQQQQQFAQQQQMMAAMGMGGVMQPGMVAGGAMLAEPGAASGASAPSMLELVREANKQNERDLRVAETEKKAENKRPGGEVMDVKEVEEMESKAAIAREVQEALAFDAERQALTIMANDKTIEIADREALEKHREDDDALQREQAFEKEELRTKGLTKLRDLEEEDLKKTNEVVDNKERTVRSRIDKARADFAAAEKAWKPGDPPVDKEGYNSIIAEGEAELVRLGAERDAQSRAVHEKWKRDRDAQTKELTEKHARERAKRQQVFAGLSAAIQRKKDAKNQLAIAMVAGAGRAMQELTASQQETYDTQVQVLREELDRFADKQKREARKIMDETEMELQAKQNDVTGEDRVEMDRVVSANARKVEEEKLRLAAERDQKVQEALSSGKQTAAVDAAKIGAAMFKENEAHIKEFESQMNRENEVHAQKLAKRREEQRKVKQRALEAEQARKLKAEEDAVALQLEKLKQESVRDNIIDQLMVILNDGNRHQAQSIIQAFLNKSHTDQKYALFKQSGKEDQDEAASELAKAYAAIDSKKLELKQQLENPNSRLTADERRDLQKRYDALTYDSISREKILAQVLNKNKERHAEQVKELQDKQWNELKEIMLKKYADETFTGPEWQQIDYAQILKDAAEKRRKEEAEFEEAKRKQEENQKAIRDKQARDLKEITDRYAKEEAEIKENAEKKKAEVEAQLEALRKKLEADQAAGLSALAVDAANATSSVMAKRSADTHLDIQASARSAQTDLENESAKHELALKKKRDEMAKRKAAELNKQQDEFQKLLTQASAATNIDFQAKEREREERTRQVNKRLQDVGLKLMKAGKLHQQKRYFAINQLVYKLTKIQRFNEMQKANQAGGAEAADGGITSVKFTSLLRDVESRLSKMLHVDDGTFKTDVPVYKDERDATYRLEYSGVVPTDLLTLTAREFVLYRFGLHLIDFLTGSNPLVAPVTLLFAESLPNKTNPQLFEDNCFKNSFHYDEPTRTLFLRRARLEDVGDYCLVLIHTLAHIRAGCEWSDTHGAFIATFYGYIRTLCTELFLGRRSAKLTYSQAQAVDHTVLNVAEFRELFGLIQRADEMKADEKMTQARGHFEDTRLGMRAAAVQNFIDLRLNSSSASSDRDPLIANEAMLARLEQYRPFASSTFVRSHLLGLERTLAAREKATSAVLGQSERERELYSDDATEKKFEVLRADIERSQSELDAAVAGGPIAGVNDPNDRARRLDTMSNAVRDKKRSLLDVVKAQQSSLDDDVDRLSAQLLTVAGQIRELTSQLIEKEGIAATAAQTAADIKDGKADASAAITSGIPTAEEMSALRSTIVNLTLTKDAHQKRLVTLEKSQADTSRSLQTAIRLLST